MKILIFKKKLSSMKSGFTVSLFAQHETVFFGSEMRLSKREKK